MVKKYTTKPVEIEAIQWNGDNYFDIFNFIGKDNHSYTRGELTIHTLEGDMLASKGDYIIRGLRGEFYPCKPDVFIQKYKEI